jgi:chromate reductase
MYPLNSPEVMVPFAQEKFDAQGRLTDAKTREKVAELVQALIVWTRRLTETSGKD